MKINDGRITILVSAKEVTIELIDNDASVTFAKVVMTNEEFCRALSRQSYTECGIDVAGFEKVGKTMEHATHEFRLPAGVDVYSRAENMDLIKLEAVKTCPEGWTPDGYFGSRDSFFQKGNNQYGRVTIRRWI